MSNLEEHVRQQRETLEAARKSVEAAQEAHNRSGTNATAEFLREARQAYDDARAAYENAAGASTAGDSTTGVGQ